MAAILKHLAGHVAAIGTIPTLGDILKKKINHDVETDSMEVWDKGVFMNELHRQGIMIPTTDNNATGGALVAKTGIKQGTYKGTQMALTEVYSLIEESAVSHFDSKGFEPVFPRKRDLTEKQKIYEWSDGADHYPPHLLAIPTELQEASATNPGVGTLFDTDQKTFLARIAMIVSFMIPDNMSHDNTPYKGPTLADCEKWNRGKPLKPTDITEGKNIGDKVDWYSDARFAQQHLSGVNPTTIETAPPNKVKAYVDEAAKQKLEGMRKLLSQGTDLFIQDYSYFREATGVKNEEEFKNVIPERQGGVPTGKTDCRYACASVVIFQLNSDGRLHPLAITLDYKGSLDNSITIFNRRLTPNDKGDRNEKDDWPWRYAKTCAQTSDWLLHEIAVHLVETHLVEEAIIVSTNRTIPDDHLLYEILSPHWFRTLALNSAARNVLVPLVIARLAGLGSTPASVPGAPPVSRAFGIVNWSYKHFNFQEKYIPNDLKKRGFNLDGHTGNKYRNYPYATDISLLWGVIHDFVKSMLATKYKSDKDIQNDPYISAWCTEIQTKGQLTTFPTITTVDQLIDAVTMCIHIAAPQHTAVNYLQDYYYSFVPSKPPALCTPLPADLKTLQTYTEKELTDALPIGTEGAKWKDWLLAAEMPEMLSYKVEARYNLITYAKSLYNVNKNRTAAENKEYDSPAIKIAAATFYSRLKELEIAFKWVSGMQTEGTEEYNVLQPELTAISILI